MEDTGWNRTKKWNGYQLRLEGDGTAFLNGDYFGINFGSMKQFIDYLETSNGEREIYLRNNPKKPIKINYNFTSKGLRIIPTNDGPRFYAPITKRLLEKIQHMHCQTFDDYSWVITANNMARKTICMPY